MISLKAKTTALVLFLLLTVVANGQSITIDSLQNNTQQNTPTSDSLDNVKRAIKVLDEYNDARNKRYERDIEQLKMNMNNMNDELIETKLDLERSHQRFKKGMMLVIIGAGALLLSSSSQLVASGRGGRFRGRRSALNNGLYAAGAVSMAVGVVICFNSHKYIGRAGSMHSKRKRNILPLD